MKVLTRAAVIALIAGAGFGVVGSAPAHASTGIAAGGDVITELIQLLESLGRPGCC